MRGESRLLDTAEHVRVIPTAAVPRGRCRAAVCARADACTPRHAQSRTALRSWMRPMRPIATVRTELNRMQNDSEALLNLFAEELRVQARALEPQRDCDAAAYSV
jgi:hypothetical protein